MKYSLNNPSLFRNDLQFPSVQAITYRRLTGIKLSLFHLHLITPSPSLRDGFTFPLGQCCEHGDKDFTRHLCGINILFFEVDADTQRSQFPHRFQTLLGVAGKSGGGLHKDAVDTPFPAVLHHPQEVIPFVYGRTGDALIGVYVCQFPIGVARDEFGVVGILRGEGVLLILGVGTDAGICCHAELSCGFLIGCRNCNDPRSHSQRTVGFLPADHLLPPPSSATHNTMKHSQ